MKIIIAPSKTMKYRDDGFIKKPLLYQEKTEYLLSLLKQYNDEELCQLMKISYKQAMTVYHYYHQPQIAYPALSFYQGTVFKQLETDQYHQHLDYLEQHLCILSAMYGLMHYNTAIYPYRLDMTMKPNHINLYEYWYTPLYQYFEDCDFIISLASHEFTSMIHHPHLYFIDFIEIDQGKLKRNSIKVKKARGQMLNEMILQEITSLEDIQKLQIDGYTYQPQYNKEHTLAFVREKQ
jgi:Uncharacterized protein conserved in bacteria